MQQVSSAPLHCRQPSVCLSHHVAPPSRSCSPPAPRGVVWSWDITKLLGPVKWDLLLPLRDPGHLQLLRSRLDGRPSGERRPGRAADRRDVRESRDRAGAAHDPRRSRILDDLQARRLAPGLSRGHARPQPPPCLRRQSVLRGAVQDPQVSADFRFATYEAARASATRSSPGTTPSIGMAASACSRRRWCTTAKPGLSAHTAPTSWPPPTTRILSGSSAGRPRCRCCRRPPSGSIRPPRPTTDPSAPRAPRPLSPSRQEPPGWFLPRGALSR
jgi:hypothetical protein